VPTPPLPLADAETIALSIDSRHARTVRSYQVRTFEVFVAQASNDEGKKLGRPKVSGRKEDAIRARLTAGDGMLRVAKSLGVGVSTVQRVKAEMPAMGVV
jgi:hypothetical protein